MQVGHWRSSFLAHPLVSTAQAAAASWRLARRTHPGLPALIVVLVVLVAGLPVAATVAMANAVGIARRVTETGLSPAAEGHLELALGLFVAAFAASVLVSGVSDVFGQRAARLVDGTLRERVMAAALAPVGIGHLEDPEMQRAFEAARSTTGARRPPGSAVQSLPDVITPRLRALGYLVVLLVVWWPYGLVLAALSLLNQSETAKSLIRVSRASRTFVPLAEPLYYRDLALMPAAAKEHRIFGLRSWLQGRYQGSMARVLREAIGANQRDAREFNGRLLGVLALNAIVMVGGIIWIARLATSGDVGLTTVALVISATMALSPQFVLADIFVVAGVRGLERIEEAERLATSLAQVSARRDDPPPLAHGIVFEGVSFAYPHSGREVLSGLDLELRLGERTAIVGVNGAGKTTLVKLLAKLYEPTAGRILVDGVDLATIDPVRWRRQLAVLFQDFVCFELPARDNVRYGALHAGRWSDEDLAGAARRIHASEIVERLPHGWSTPLSARVNGGVDLSGGQWQRIAFARALFALEMGARVLVLDEPTANLDVRAEANLYEEFGALTDAPSPEGIRPLTVLVSHRLSTVRQADRSVVLAEGRVAEDGTHVSLVAAGGLYARMFEAQASRFVEGERTGTG